MDNVETIGVSEGVEIAPQAVSDLPEPAPIQKPRRRKQAAAPEQPAQRYPLGIRVIDN